MFDGSGSLADWLGALATTAGVLGAALVWLRRVLRPEPPTVVADLAWLARTDRPELYALVVAAPAWGALIVRRITVSRDLEIAAIAWERDAFGEPRPLPNGFQTWGDTIAVDKSLNAFAGEQKLFHQFLLRRRSARTSRRPSSAVIHLTATSPISREFTMKIAIITANVSA